MPRNRQRTAQCDPQLPPPSSTSDNACEFDDLDACLAKLRAIAGGAERLDRLLLEILRDRGGLAHVRSIVGLRSEYRKEQRGHPPLYSVDFLMDVERLLNDTRTSVPGLSNEEIIVELIDQRKITPPSYGRALSRGTKAHRIEEALKEHYLIRRMRKRQKSADPHMYDLIDWGDTDYFDSLADEPTEDAY
jgi:hypothetical protein